MNDEIQFDDLYQSYVLVTEDDVILLGTDDYRSALYLAELAKETL